MHILPETNAINIIAKEGKKHSLIIKDNAQKQQKKRTDEKNTREYVAFHERHEHGSLPVTSTLANSRDGSCQ